MKTAYLLLFLLCATTFTADAYTSLTMRDPHRSWVYTTPKIDSATFSIQPKGAYFECGLYLTFSPTSTYSGDTFEIIMDFDLPTGAMVNDSWLWVGNQIVQAVITDRSRAGMVYEGIVQRRQDPSILYKNSATQYQLRVYPLPANQKRKVKISYLLPATWGSTRAGIPLPVSLLKTSNVRPPLTIITYPDANWYAAGINELSGQLFTPQPNGSERTIITPATLNNNSYLNFSMAHSLTNGVYSAVHESAPGQGFYQLVVVPGDVIQTGIHQKLAVLFDHNPTNTYVTGNQVLQNARTMLHQSLGAQDSFNLIFTQFNIHRISNVWLPADSQTIENVFAPLLTNNPVSSYSSLPALLSNGIDFLKANNGGEILLMSSNQNYGVPATANQLINDVVNYMLPEMYPIHIADYVQTNITSNYINNTCYAGNSYFNANLTALTGGVLKSMMNMNYCYSYGYSNYSTFDLMMNDVYGLMGGYVTNFDVYTDVDSGFCYSRFNSSGGTMVGLKNAFVQVGKYTGKLPMAAEITGMFKGTPFQYTLNIGNTYVMDSTVRMMWAGNYINTMEVQQLDNQGIAALQQVSIQNRVLSQYTAFLALEPSDTTQACSDCNDETGTGGSTGIQNLNDAGLSIKAYPNPFSEQLTITLKLSEPAKDLKWRIVNLMGQVVREGTLEAGATEYSFTWDGKDANGSSVAAGVYLVEIETTAGKQIARIVKN
ncbi:MAG: FlgD immunoglobulin-like domain containing protein [Chitinophagales bacterium]